MYFNMFPNLIYDPVGNGSGKLAKNILKRIRVRNNMKKEFAMLDPYDVQEAETPEIVADRHHGSPYYHLVVMMMNDLKDPMHDWPRSTRQMQLFMKGKYGSAENQNAVHHYEVAQASGDSTIMIEVPSDYPNAYPVSNYTYEYNLNESKRSIDLLRNEFLGQFVSEFQDVLVG